MCGQRNPDTNVGGINAPYSEVSDDQKRRTFFTRVQAGASQAGARSKDKHSPACTLSRAKSALARWVDQLSQNVKRRYAQGKALRTSSARSRSSKRCKRL